MNHAVKIELDVYVATRYTSVGGLECLLQQTLSSLCRPIGKHDTGPSQNSLGAQNLRSPRYLVLNQVIETQRLESFAEAPSRRRDEPAGYERWLSILVELAEDAREEVRASRREG